MIICSLSHCRMQEYLKVESQMSDKRIQLIRHVALRSVSKYLSYLSMVIFACGCSQLPIEVGVERSEIAEESAEVAGQLTNEIEVKQSIWHVLKPTLQITRACKRILTGIVNSPGL